MTALQAPLVSLQAPKDVSIDLIEAELREIWQTHRSGTDGLAASRASTFTFIVYEEPESLQADNPQHDDIAEAIAAVNPCRIINLCPTTEANVAVTAKVSAYCPMQQRNQQSLVCCETITLQGSAEELERIGGLISALTLSGLPKFVWWKAPIKTESVLFQRLLSLCDNFIIDSSDFRDPVSTLNNISQLFSQKAPIADLNWQRLSAWQELTAQGFDPPERRDAIPEIDRLTVDYEKGNISQALMYLGWVASRLQWRPVSFHEEGGDYDISRVIFATSDQRKVEAELAAIPVADVGDILGDLISIKMSSTNLQADCCTVICSGTTGCMRMEAGGGAQACRIQQVSALADQNRETVLKKQLQRWGRDDLYIDSMKVVHQILQLPA